MDTNETGAGSRLPTASPAEGGAVAHPEGASPTSHTELASLTPAPGSPPRSATGGTGSRAPRASQPPVTRPTAPGASTETAWTPTPGMRLLQYELIRPLGSGGMGT